MTELMQLLFDYARETSRAASRREETLSLSSLTERLSRQLQQELPPAQWDTVEKYRDALLEQRDLELEALFLATLALSRELR